jgi:hypothetical protein
MHLEIATCCCTVPTPRDLTGVGALPRVGPHMRLKITAFSRTVATPRDLTGVWALPGVGAHVRLNMATGRCTVATPRDLTGVRTLPRVGAQMRLESVLPCGHIPTPWHATCVSLIHSKYLKYLEGLEGVFIEKLSVEGGGYVRYGNGPQCWGETPRRRGSASDAEFLGGGRAPTGGRAEFFSCCGLEHPQPNPNPDPRPLCPV